VEDGVAQLGQDTADRLQTVLVVTVVGAWLAVLQTRFLTSENDLKTWVTADVNASCANVMNVWLVVWLVKQALLNVLLVALVMPPM
jgi:hypothetical protein